MLKKFTLCRIHFSSLGLYIFIEFPLVLVLSLNLKNLWQSVFSFPVIILHASTKSPLLRLSSKVVKLKALSLSLYSKFLNSGTSLVARCWIFSKHSMSFFRYGFQAWTANSIWGLIYVLYKIEKFFLSEYEKVLLANPNAWDAFYAASAHCKKDFASSVIQIPRSFSFVTSANSVFPNTYVSSGLFLPKYITLHFSSLNFISHFLDHSSKFSKSWSNLNLVFSFTCWNK